MVDYKQTRKAHLIILFLYLVLFPFGQLAKAYFYPTDLLVLLSAFIFLISKNKSFYLGSSIVGFLGVCLFSLAFSLAIFRPADILIGVLYFVRLASYLFFFVNIWNLTKNDFKLKRLIFRSLIVVGVSVAIFGWVQYLVFPDLRGLTIFGWDDHYFRLASTFLDPAFTGIILVFTFFLVLVSLEEKLSISGVFLCLFILATIAFTYSRSSYLALLGGGLVLLFKNSRRKAVIFSLFALLVLLPFLPRPASEGVKLERLNSVFNKIVDYKESVVLIGKSPVFGLGFNNICEAKSKFLGEVNINSHSCSGLDNSFLLIVATTGIVGLMMFIKLAYDFVATTEKSIFGKAFLAVGVAMMIHTMFTNTLFYPWVLGWVGLLGGVSRIKE